MADFLSFIADQVSKSDLGDWAQQHYGQSNPMLADLAQADPESFRTLLPNLIKTQNESSAIQQYYSPQPQGTPAQPGQPSPALAAFGMGGDANPNAEVPQQLPSQDGSALGAMTPGTPAIPPSADQLHQSALAKLGAIANLPPALQSMAAQQMAMGGIGGDTSNLTGASYLQSLPQAMAARVQGIAEGKLPYPPSNSRSPQDMMLKQMVEQYEPGFDATAWKQRESIQKSLASGPDAQNIAALNTAMSHLSNLQDAYQKLGNSDYPIYNAVANYAGNQLGDRTTQSSTAAVATDARATSHELAKVFRQSGMSEGEVKDWENSISTSAAPASSDQIIQSAMDLMEGRLSAVANKVNSAIPGANKAGIDFLSPEGRAAYNKIRGLPADQAIPQGNPSVLPPTAGNQPSALSQLSSMGASSPGMPQIQVPQLQPPEQSALGQMSQQKPTVYKNPKTGERGMLVNGKWKLIQ